MTSKLDNSQQEQSIFTNPEQFQSTGGIWRGIIIPDLPSPLLPIELGVPKELPTINTTGNSAIHSLLQSKVSAATININPAGVEIPLVVTQPPTKVETDAQLSVPAHRLSKQLGAQAVQELANKIISDPELAGIISKANVDGSFVNFSFERSNTNRQVLEDVLVYGDFYGSNNSGDGGLVVMDVSSPNIAKEMHLGHLRSTVIGESIRRILEFNGYNVMRDNHVGDWGTQFGLLGKAVEIWGHEVEDLLQSDNDADQIKGLLQLYVKINDQIAQEQATSTDGESSALMDAGREWFVGLESGNPAALEFWKYASQLSMKEFDEIYAKLGVEFEYMLGESVYEGSNQSVIEQFKAAGLTFVNDRGVVKVNPSTNRGDALGIQKPDGTSLYGTRDLATIASRMHWFKPDKIVYVVGGDQNEYFTNLFDAMNQYLGEDAGHLDLTHVSFGAVETVDGPMSTRKGTVIPMREVITLLEDSVREKVAANLSRQGVDLVDDELEDVVRQVAIGSLIYYDLRGVSKRKIVYDPEEITTFEGNTGVYLQYSVARINSLLDKASYEPSAEHPQWHFKQKDEVVNELIDTIGDLPEIVRKAGEKYEPSIVAEFLHKVASTYNRLLAEENVLENKDQARRIMLLELSAATRQVLKNGMSLLNIPSPIRL